MAADLALKHQHLWRAAHLASDAGNPDLAAFYVSRLVGELVAAHERIPRYVSTRICWACSALLVDGASASARLAPVVDLSRAQRATCTQPSFALDLPARPKPRNALVRRCHRCGHAAAHDGALRTFRPRSKGRQLRQDLKRSRSAEADRPAAPESAPEAVPEPAPRAPAAAPRRRKVAIPTVSLAPKKARDHLKQSLKSKLKASISKDKERKKKRKKDGDGLSLYSFLSEVGS